METMISPEQSNGHIGFVNGYEYFIAPGEGLLKAPISSFMQENGYRAGARYETKESQASERFEQVRCADYYFNYIDAPVAASDFCPICGETVTLVKLSNGRLVGSCGDAFPLDQWLSVGIYADAA